ncbi:hypothetical protein DRE_04370 [Drechslerella stenobrocha 248]|uniref:Uncharacterized protein n=1 Tax=Drechslerella stenobrocha 248 TaxID=1043628 RepID=W7I1N1_9PEZI|nr:hypothetical protein DRE_04370 [Drechslerella stenobrocha 248]
MPSILSQRPPGPHGGDKQTKTTKTKTKTKTTAKNDGEVFGVITDGDGEGATDGPKSVALVAAARCNTSLQNLARGRVGHVPTQRSGSGRTVNLVSSICLFSAAVVSALSAQLVDSPTAVPQQPPFTLSELDSLARLSNTIADFVCSISASSPGTCVAITLDIPRIQYYLSGPCSHFHLPAIASAWTAIVDTRKALIETTFARCIAAEIARRTPLADRRPLYTIRPSEGLDLIRPFILDSIAAGTTVSDISIDECIVRLKGSVPEWDLFFERLPLATPLPRTLEELWFASYVFELIRPFLSAVIANTSTQSSHPDDGSDDILILQIDNIVESKPYIKARKFLEAYAKAERKAKAKRPSTKVNGSRGNAHSSSSSSSRVAAAAPTTTVPESHPPN